MLNCSQRPISYHHGCKSRRPIDNWSPLFPRTCKWSPTSVITACNNQGLALITLLLCYWWPVTDRYCSLGPITDHQYSQTSLITSIPNVSTKDYCFQWPRPSTDHHDCSSTLSITITIVYLTQRLFFSSVIISDSVTICNNVCIINVLSNRLTQMYLIVLSQVQTGL